MVLLLAGATKTKVVSVVRSDMPLPPVEPIRIALLPLAPAPVVHADFASQRKRQRGPRVGAAASREGAATAAAAAKGGIGKASAAAATEATAAIAAAASSAASSAASPSPTVLHRGRQQNALTRSHSRCGIAAEIRESEQARMRKEKEKRVSEA